MRGYRGGLLAFGAIVLLVVGGLGWVTADALRLEQEHRHARAQEELASRLQLALSLLDSRVRPTLAKEDSRPYNHYSALFVPSQAFARTGKAWIAGEVVEPSPLLSVELPDWILLHFQASEETGWQSPEVLSATMTERFRNAELEDLLENVTPERARLLAELAGQLPPRAVLAAAQEHGAVPTFRDTTVVPAPRPNNDPIANAQPQGQLGGQGMVQNPVNPGDQQLDPGFRARLGQGSRVSQEGKAAVSRDELEVVNNNLRRNGEDWLQPRTRKSSASEPIEVVMSPMVPVWLTTSAGRPVLVVARVVRVANQEICQGIVLDWPALQRTLTAEVSDQFPEGRVLPVPDALPAGDGTVRLMAALPVQLDPGPAPAEAPAGWTPLRVGLTLAWSAALVALLACGLGGWVLLDLSERRIRFVSAVTHELRTPLTTLRLYLDMLTGGMVKEEQQRHEYLETLHGETERLNRLVGNVLDFSRLENRRARPAKATVAVTELLGRVRTTWEGRCRSAEKELVVEDGTDGVVVETDGGLVEQVVGNLIDNACKYTRGAADGRLWLRSAREGRRLVLEVEDRGPGVPVGERRSIFRPFRRGRTVETTAGGVGLGLALAGRWAKLLGGSLTLNGGREGVGACFRLELPLAG
jgi:signal transduction histidine kinase